MKNGGRKKSSKEATKDSDVEELTSGSDIETKPVGKAGKETSSAKDRAKEIVLETSESDMSDTEIKKKSSKKDAKRNGNSKPDKKQRKSRKDPDFMKVKLDVTDSDEQEEKSKRRREKAKKKVLEESDDDDIEEESPSKKSGRKGRKAKKIASSDFEDEMGSENESEDKMEEDKSEDLDDEDSDIGTKKKVAKNKKKRKKKSSSSSGETSDDEPRPKKKRRRIKKNDSSGDDEEKEKNEDENESPTKGGGRKDIRKIIKDKKLSDSTKEAAELERARRKRVEEKQALYNEMNEIKDNAVVKEVLLDVESETREILVQVNTKLPFLNSSFWNYFNLFWLFSRVNSKPTNQRSSFCLCFDCNWDFFV